MRRPLPKTLIKSTIPKQPLSTGKNPPGRPKGSTKRDERKDQTFTLPRGTKNLVDPNESCIAKRLTRGREIPNPETPVSSEKPSSSSEITTDEELNEDSDPPVFRKSHSGFPSVEITPKQKQASPKIVGSEDQIQTTIPLFSPAKNTYTDVYVDGACSFNGSGEPRAGIGIWFGHNHPLNISQRSKGRQTNNAAEIEAATVAALKAQEAGIQNLRINTDSKFLIQSVTDWIPKWKLNQWKTKENKPVKNRIAFEKLTKALEPLNVVWEHIPSHQGLTGNEMADQLAKEGVNKEQIMDDFEIEEEKEEEICDLENVIINIAPQPIGSTEEESDVKVWKVKSGLEKSFQQFDKSMQNRGFDQTNLTLAWDHEGMDKEFTRPELTHVSEGENDEELLDTLEALDPCQNSDVEDDAFTERIRKFLDNYNKRQVSNVEIENSPRPSPTLPAKQIEGRQSTVRFRDDPDVMHSPAKDYSQWQGSIFQTPGFSVIPDAQSTPFVYMKTNGSKMGKKSSVVPRRLQEKTNDNVSGTKCTPIEKSSKGVGIPYYDSPSFSDTCDDNDFKITKDVLTKNNVIQKWSEPLTYERDNYAHFMSEDCEPVDAISKLLVATERIDLQELQEKRPKIGQILITPSGRYCTYSIIVKQRHYDEIDWRNVILGLKNLKLALSRDTRSTCRMANTGDLLGSLPQGKMTELLTKIFRGGDIIMILCHGKIEVPPPELRPKIISEYHESLLAGHKGITKTYRRIRERYLWPRMRDEITEFIRGCQSCLQNKLVRARTREPMIITDTPAGPFDKVSLDTVGKLPTTPNGNRYILTMQDNFSKYCIAVPISDIKTTTIAHAVATHLFSQFGAPRCVLTDRGGSFISSLMRKLERIFGVKQITTSGYRPQTNGALERSHIELTDFIKHYAEDFDDWDRLLPFAMFNYNTSVHEATNFTPYELVFGKLARIPSSFPQGPELETYGSYLKELITRMSEIQGIAAKNLVQAKLKSKEYHDRTARPLKAKIGDKVFAYKEIRANKFDKRAEGPYTVVGFTQNNNVILEDENNERFSKHKDKLMMAYC
ncbi:uncharacterized protein LOC127291410 [Leptopilina boulardi]|uniref:uncharacterized protein LOC127277059 n=1 Tax=Leptopilina boulardi TaxID=63433 RepID=UPI0021F4FE19|nr:uncharacterized protein LOC127277059 [Leptopilina boulardi]XP_051160080.1 uncharacterized protein LOC127280837 [Leptopilina boulardi]XP_051170037.1 uncharacterized protein LOC127287252 [Leptopilina boulardi]XP_051173699.1 uncharacterized protein LOC127289662 [Leptopilina boulardi]XP_051175599.1 uncharacterized protein LOC127290827 [Leptopilina boulardi]XP_051176497.1 uncharacterized protein LOC127291410 [Leptopilina boulardi]